MTGHTAFEAFTSELSAREGELTKLLPRNVVSVDRFMTCAVLAIKQTPALLHCDRRSLHNEITKAARDGLVPDGRRAVIVPFKDDKRDLLMAGYIPMYQGLLQRMREFGGVGPIRAEVVRARDVFEFESGDDIRLVHRRASLGTDRGEIIGAFAIFEIDGVIWHREVFDRADIEKARSVSRAANSPAWRNWYEEMARIRPIRRGSKYVPLPDELQAIIEREDELVDLEQTPAFEPIAAPRSTPPTAPLTVVHQPAAEILPPAAATVRTAAPSAPAKKLAPIDIGFGNLKPVRRVA